MKFSEKPRHRAPKRTWHKMGPGKCGQFKGSCFGDRANEPGEHKRPWVAMRRKAAELARAIASTKQAPAAEPKSRTGFLGFMRKMLSRFQRKAR